MKRFILQTVAILLLTLFSALGANMIALKRAGKSPFFTLDAAALVEASRETRPCDQEKLCPRKIGRFPYFIPWNWQPVEAYPPEVKGYSFIHLQDAHTMTWKGRVQFLDARPYSDIVDTGTIRGAFPFFADFSRVSPGHPELGTEFEERMGIYEHFLQTSGLNYVAFCYGGECDDSKILTCNLSNLGFDVRSLYVMKENLPDWQSRYPEEVSPRGPVYPTYFRPARYRGWRTVRPRTVETWMQWTDQMGEGLLAPRNVVFLDVRSPENFYMMAETVEGAEIVNSTRMMNDPAYLEERLERIGQTHSLRDSSVAILYSRNDPYSAFELAAALHERGLGLHESPDEQKGELSEEGRARLFQIVVLRSAIEDWLTGDHLGRIPREMPEYPTEEAGW